MIRRSKNDLKKRQEEIVEELVKIGEASENKKIDIKDPRVKDAITSLINAEPDKNEEPAMGAKPVLSINSTIQNIQENISKFVKKTRTCRLL
ncbi:hypothetical protein [Rickettsia helvetica]|uniref:Acyl-[acyl-carrier-protein]--UDP-N-acetylglucosamine O-acyltransferase n=1 Tax=Rickettsia helvetica TaxID=35789 RepID=A0ABM9NCU6_RICHE|nr:hypothetical protein [Rickettsia helvetica]MCZ6883941.1 hypothetical protein [Rickettsia endosymbiont of Ixodes ricinus]MCZ6897046.1 hypothetical protein [Rickettsia endosymbiont of Ixodes ricinus]